jgi:spore coat polysaccharide biosynthesis predicted glycosyltransferase SpsG
LALFLILATPLGNLNKTAKVDAQTYIISMLDTENIPNLFKVSHSSIYSASSIIYNNFVIPFNSINSSTNTSNSDFKLYEIFFAKTI